MYDFIRKWPPFAIEAKEQTTGTIVALETDKLQTGTAFALNAHKLTTGTAFSIHSDSNGADQRSLVKFVASNNNAGKAQVEFSQKRFFEPRRKQ